MFIIQILWKFFALIFILPGNNILRSDFAHVASTLLYRIWIMNSQALNCEMILSLLWTCFVLAGTGVQQAESNSKVNFLFFTSFVNSKELATSETVWHIGSKLHGHNCPYYTWTKNPPGLHNFPFGLQTVYHYISAWISETPLTFMVELVVSFIGVVCIILCTNLP